MTSIIPCKNCGGELYDSVRKYHFDVPCEKMDAGEQCYNFKDNHWTKASFCSTCNIEVTTVKATDEELALVAKLNPLK